MCTPKAPKASTTPKADPLRVLLSRDKYNTSGGGSGYLLPPRSTQTASTGGLPMTGVGLNTRV